VKPLSSSFRDPAGYVFSESGTIKRGITDFGRKNYEAFMGSGLYERLVQSRSLIPHEAAQVSSGEFYKIIVPGQIPVISYPYEWCFSELKDAAILTLTIQLTALESGFGLKDATPFNVQFIGSRPVFIDTLSFEPLKEEPWVAYRQFCESFLAPLVCMAEIRQDFNKYLKTDLDGFDLEFCRKILPPKTWIHLGYLTHIHLHGLSQAKFKDKAVRAPGSKGSVPARFSKRSLIALTQHLLSTVNGIRLKNKKTAWSDYYADQCHYSENAENFKSRQVSEWLKTDSPRLALDLGANTGKFGRLATQMGVYCVGSDLDASCVEENYLLSKSKQDEKMLPLLMDLSNPAGGLGWQAQEREPFFQRVKPDLTMALALIHHLRITHNIPLDLLSVFFSQITKNLIIEFVPKEDPMAQKLLQNREDIFHDYREENFERSFASHFSIDHKIKLPETHRTLYHLKSKG